MGWKRSCKEKLRYCVYCRKRLNKRLSCFKCSLDEVIKFLNTGSCHG